MQEAHSARKIRLIAILTSLIMGLVILAIKFYAAKVSDSAALRSDALEGTVNVLAAAFGLWAVIFAEKPADKEHPYGHGKIEYFSSVFEGGLITLAGVLIMIDAISRLLHESPLTDLSSGLKLNILAGVMNGLLGLGLYIVGRKHRSEILRADGIHLLTDLLTTVVLGIGLVIILFTGWTVLDPILAFGVAIFLFKTGYSIVRDSSNALLDAENTDVLNDIILKLNTIDRGSVITVHELKAQQFGRDVHVDLHLVVPEYFSIKEAHSLSDKFEMKLQEKMGDSSMIHTHIDPCNQMHCAHCHIQSCPIRKKPFVSQGPFTLEEATKKDIVYGSSSAVLSD